MRRTTAVVAIAAALGVSACEADRETFEAGADLAPPPEVEAAPEVPFPPTPVVTGGDTQATDSVAPMGTDSATQPMGTGTSGTQPSAPR